VTAQLAADAVLLLHAGFVLWVVLGGLAVLWRRWLAGLHLPALAWGLWIELSHGICPLTPLENQLRLAAGQAGYEGSFVAQYLLPLLYPPGLTPGLQWTLAAALAGFNLLVYGAVLWRARRRL
jgi:hypothetical protein